MKSRLAILPILLVVGMTASTACGNGGTAGTPPADPPPADRSPASENLVRKGEVLEAIDAGRYTYVRVLTAEGETWAAGPLTPVAAGDIIMLPQGVLMSGFHSKTMNRTFEAIYFVSAIKVVGGDKTEPVTSLLVSSHASATPTASVEVGSIEKPEGGFTIAELFARREEISGKGIIVRGKVVKFTASVMGRNWVHIQDGSGEAGSNDLTITTQATVTLGDIILVQGKAAVDKDFGAGYKYSLIVEEATITSQ
jgi:hypothetical protein